MSENTVTAERLMAYAWTSADHLSPTLRQVHLVLARRFDEEKGTTVLTNSELASLVGISPRSVTRMKQQLREAGVWGMVDGGNTPTIYIPSAELVAILEKKEGHQ